MRINISESNKKVSSFDKDTLEEICSETIIGCTDFFTSCPIRIDDYIYMRYNTFEEVKESPIPFER